MRIPVAKVAAVQVGLLRTLAIALPLALAFARAATAAVPEPAPLAVAIPAEPLAEALAAFARQTGLHVAYLSGVIHTQRSRAVDAGLGAVDALGRLLEGTGLKFEFLTSRSVRILAAEPAPSPLPPAPNDGQPTTEVIVTGSRIPVPVNISATSPMQVLTRQDIALQGRTDAVDLLSALPQMTISSGADFGNYSNPSNTAGGFATADLRGLGPHRTVVLINGRRLGLGDANTANPTPAPDLDQIPLALVERVEVLTGGASATYGSDAIAGVVNFILKDHVQGVEVDGHYGFAQHTQHNGYLQGVEADAGISPPTGRRTDGDRRAVSVLAGTDFAQGRGQLTGYFVFQNQDAVHGSDRDYSACSFHSTNQLSGVPTDPGVTCLPSAQSNLFITDPVAGIAYSVVGTEFQPWPAANAVPPAFFNAAPYYSSQRGDTRYQAGLLAHLELGPAARPYLEVGYMQDRTRTQIAPGGIFSGSNPATADGAYLVNCSNPLLSAQEAAILCTPAQIAADRAAPGSVSADVDIGRRNIEGGGRRYMDLHRNLRAVAGIDGALGAAWRYSAYALYHRTSLSQAVEDYFSFAAINDALQVTTGPAGNAVCISGGSCVPYNIFGTGPVTAEQLAYLYRPGSDTGSNGEEIIEADVTGQLGRYGLTAPWARDGVAFNAGVEHRTETLSFSPDAVERSGDLAGWGVTAVAIDKRVSVEEAFVEVRVPLAQARPVLHDLSVDAGYRYSSYSTAGTTNTYKFDLQYAPIEDVRLRASYDHVVRAPNLIEIYTPLSYAPSQVLDTDPCAPADGGATHASASLAACQHTGITAAQYGNGLGAAFGGTSTVPQCFISCGVVAGGNAALAPETANTWSTGLTFTPTAIPSLTGSIDYFRIRLKGAIGNVPESVTLQQCLTTGDPVLCSQIVRRADGALSGSAAGGYIMTTAVNTGSALVAGIDLQASYRQALAPRFGAVRMSLNGSWLEHNAATPYRSAPSYDCAGLFGATCLDGSVNPRWRHVLRVTWETPWDLQVSAQWRYLGGSRFDNNAAQPLLQNREEGFYDPLLTRVASYSYLDLAAIWHLTDRVNLRVGANNLLDKDPPFVPLEVSGRNGGLNTFPVYDVLGRTIFMALSATL